MNAYLFAHFREKRTPDGEQVHFAVSPDGLHWRALNHGRPVLWSFLGDMGVRDIAIRRTDTGFVILATDLSLAYGMPGKYGRSWENISRSGSQCLMAWDSPDLIHWSPQREISFAGCGFGCLWAPDVFFDARAGDYIVHWSSARVADGPIAPKAIYFARTRDFLRFTAPEVLYRKPEGDVIDAALYQEGEAYYLFVKSQRAPAGVTLLRAPAPTGPFSPVEAFSPLACGGDPALFEAPMYYRLPDGRACLMVDFFGVPGKGQGYVPLVAPSLADPRFARADAAFSFPYGFKHGSVMEITPDEYAALCAQDEFPENAPRW